MLPRGLRESRKGKRERERENAGREAEDGLSEDPRDGRKERKMAGGGGVCQPDTRRDSAQGRGDDSWHGTAARPATLPPPLPPSFLRHSLCSPSPMPTGRGGGTACERDARLVHKLQPREGGAPGTEGRGREQLARRCPPGRWRQRRPGQGTGIQAEAGRSSGTFEEPWHCAPSPRPGLGYEETGAPAGSWQEPGRVGKRVPVQRRRARASEAVPPEQRRDLGRGLRDATRQGGKRGTGVAHAGEANPGRGYARWASPGPGDGERCLAEPPRSGPWHLRSIPPAPSPPPPQVASHWHPCARLNLAPSQSWWGLASPRLAREPNP